jgi:hypothetical protein
MKVIACVVIFCFLYQDIVRAASPAPIIAPGLAPNPAAVLRIDPQQFSRMPIPELIRSTLLQASSQDKTTQIQFPSGRVLEMENPSQLSSEKINHIYDLLRKKPCGTQSLHDYLHLFGGRQSKSHVSSILFSIDLGENLENFESGLNTKPEDLKNSLYAIEKASQLLGEPLEAVKLKPYFLGGKLSEITPFIAHFKYGHYVLVKEADAEKVRVVSNGEELIYSQKDFQDKFSGYAAISLSRLPADYIKLSSQETKKIKGAEAHWSQASGMLSDNAAQVNDITSDIKSASLKSLAVSVGSAFVIGGMSWGGTGGNTFQMGRLGWSMPDITNTFSSIGYSAATGAVMGAVSGIGDIKGWDTQTTRMVGAVAGGSVFGGFGMSSYGSINGGWGGLAIGALSNAAGVLTYDLIAENMDNEWGGALASLASGVVGRYTQNFVTAGLGGFETSDGDRTSWSDAFGVANSKFVTTKNLSNITRDAISSSIEVIGETQFDLDPVYSHAIGSFAGSIGANYLGSRLNQPPIEGWEEMNKDQRYDALEKEFKSTPEWGGLEPEQQVKILNTALAAFDPSWVNLAAGGLLEGAFSMGVAYTEDWVGENVDFGSFHTPLTEAMVVNAITGVARGVGEWVVGKTSWYDTLKNTFAFHSTYLASEGISGMKTNLGDFFAETKPPSLIGSIINNTASSLKTAGLNTLTLGGYGYQNKERDAYAYMSMQVGPQGVFMPQITPFDGIDALRIIDGDTQHNIRLAQAFQQTSGYEDYDYFDKGGNLNQSVLEDALEDYQNQDVSYEWQIIQGMHNLGHDLYHQGSISNLTGIIQATPAFKYFGYQPILPIQIKLPNLSSVGEEAKGTYFDHYRATLHRGHIAWAPTNINSKSPEFYERAFSENGARHWGTSIDFGDGNVKSLSLTRRMNPIINYYESGGERLATDLSPIPNPFSGGATDTIDLGGKTGKGFQAYEQALEEEYPGALVSWSDNEFAPLLKVSNTVDDKTATLFYEVDINDEKVNYLRTSILYGSGAEISVVPKYSIYTARDDSGAIRRLGELNIDEGVYDIAEFIYQSAPLDSRLPYHFVNAALSSQGFNYNTIDGNIEVGEERSYGGNLLPVLSKDYDFFSVTGSHLGNLSDNKIAGEGMVTRYQLAKSNGIDFVSTISYAQKTGNSSNQQVKLDDVYYGLSDIGNIRGAVAMKGQASSYKVALAAFKDPSTGGIHQGTMYAAIGRTHSPFKQFYRAFRTKGPTTYSLIDSEPGEDGSPFSEWRQFGTHAISELTGKDKWNISGDLTFLNTVYADKKESRTTQWSLNVTGAGSMFQNAGSDKSSTPLAPGIGIANNEILFNTGSQLLLTANDSNGYVIAVSTVEASGYFSGV